MPSRSSGSGSVAAAGRESSSDLPEPQQLHAEIKERFGVLPNFFRLAPDNPEITASLWGFARFAYLENPLPSVFKERLFVYLSRFLRCPLLHRPAPGIPDRVGTSRR